MMAILDPRLIAAAAAQPQNMWNPVLGFLLPLYGQLVAAAVRSDGLCGVTDSEGHDIVARCAWQQALAAFAVLGFEYVPDFGCKRIDNESANERALNAAITEAAQEAR